MNASRFGRLPAALLLAGTLAGVSAGWPTLAGADEEVVTVGNAAYVSGGTGEDSRERLTTLSQGFGFNLKVTFALQGGEYLSGVDVRIVDRAGKVVLQAKTDGPIFLARLPAGSYDFFASVDGREQKQKLTVAAGKLGNAVFRWPSVAP